jgi:hypothetical protein
VNCIECTSIESLSLQTLDEYDMKLTIFFLLISSYVFFSYQEHSALEKDNLLLEKFKIRWYDWSEAADYMAKMILNDKEVASKGRAEITIWTVPTDKTDSVEYSVGEFVKNFIQNGDLKFVVKYFYWNQINGDQTADFLVLIMKTNLKFDCHFFMSRIFWKIFMDRSLKIFVVAHHHTDNSEITTMIIRCNKYFIQMEYLNIYYVLLKPGNQFKIYRMMKSFNVLKKIDTLNDQPIFEPAKSFFAYSVHAVIHFDQPPLSYSKNRKVYGVEGKFLDELCKKTDTPYLIANKNTSISSINEIYSIVSSATGMFSTYTGAQINMKSAKNIVLYEKDGFCMLVPRNIPISSIDNFSFPFDRTTTILIAVAIPLVIIVWKVLRSTL